MKIQSTIIACIIGSSFFSAQELQVPALIPIPNNWRELFEIFHWNNNTIKYSVETKQPWKRVEDFVLTNPFQLVGYPKEKQFWWIWPSDKNPTRSKTWSL